MKTAHGWPPGGYVLPSRASAAPAATLAAPAPDAAPLGHFDTDDPPPAAAETALPRLLSIGDVEQVFNRSARTLRRWIRLGYLAPVRLGGAVFFDPGDIRRLIAGRLSAAVLAR
jgi:hypothetical protein